MVLLLLFEIKFRGFAVVKPTEAQLKGKDPGPPLKRCRGLTKLHSELNSQTTEV